MNTTLLLADALRTAANRAADLIEKLDIENDTMKAAKLGVLPDGTPVEDIVAELSEVKSQLIHLQLRLRKIHTVVNTPGVTVKLIRNVLED